METEYFTAFADFFKGFIQLFLKVQAPFAHLYVGLKIITQVNLLSMGYCFNIFAIQLPSSQTWLPLMQENRKAS